jgi:hypothetical protein
MKTNNTKTPMIKAKAFNAIQQYFRSNRKYDYQKRQYVEHNPLFTLSDKEKLEHVTAVMQEVIAELNRYKKSRKEAKKVHEIRLVNGYYDKKAMKRAKSKLMQDSKVKQTK